MGLDNNWITESGEKIEFDPHLSLVGACLSEGGSSSFRGKVYNDFFVKATGYSLYCDLTKDQVKEIAETLGKLTGGEIKQLAEEYFLGWDNPEGQIEDLRRMFQEYAKRNAELQASW